MRVFGCGNQDGVDILERQQVFEMLEAARRAPVGFLRPCCCLFAIDLPKVTDGSQFRVVLIFQLPDDPLELTTAVANADVTERNAVIGAGNAAVRNRRAGDRGGPHRRGAAVQKRAPADFLWLPIVHDSSPRIAWYRLSLPPSRSRVAPTSPFMSAAV